VSDVALRLEHVYKKFRKGEVYNSLRDLIPALTGRMFRQPELSPGDEREFWALQDVSFELKRGQAFGVIGPNGAGKSTLLKVLSRVMRPSSGLIEVNGRISALIELAAGFHQDLTGRENIQLYGTILGMTRREIDAKFEGIVEFSGLKEFIDTPVKRYSSGMYARLGFAVAAHVDPDILLVDEVLSVGDTLFQRKCVDHMRKIIQNGATVLFVSHSLKTVADFCSQTVLLDHGHAVTIGPTPKVITHYMTRMREDRATNRSRAVVISKVGIRDANGPCHRFESGQKAWIDVQVSAHESCDTLTLVLYLRDENHYVLLSTTTERLGHGNVSLNAGDIWRCTFELKLNLGEGVFYPSVNLYRHDNEQVHDVWEAAETIYVWSQDDVSGPVNCFPRVINQEVSQKELREADDYAADDFSAHHPPASTASVPPRLN
jgi:lipopolysaccharide transport system ATP-binding protein